MNEMNKAETGEGKALRVRKTSILLLTITASALLSGSLPAQEGDLSDILRKQAECQQCLNQYLMLGYSIQDAELMCPACQ